MGVVSFRYFHSVFVGHTFFVTKIWAFSKFKTSENLRFLTKYSRKAFKCSGNTPTAEGRGVVIMDPTHYNEKIIELLDDKNTYDCPVSPRL